MKSIVKPYLGHKNEDYLDPEEHALIQKKGGKYRVIQKGSWWINKNTPVGDDADYYERKPHGGKAMFHFSDIVGYIVEQEETFPCGKCSKPLPKGSTSCHHCGANDEDE